jgi:DNA-nicking Smr family endonuclease
MFEKDEQEQAKQEAGAETEKEESETTFEEQEFYNWCDANDIDRGIDGMDDDDRKNFLKIKRHFTTAIKEQRLVVDGDHFTYTVSDRSPNAGQKLAVKRPNGRAMLAMDGYKENQQQQKLIAFIAAISGVEKRNIAEISALDDKDYKVLQDVSMLFLTG